MPGLLFVVMVHGVLVLAMLLARAGKPESQLVSSPVAARVIAPEMAVEPSVVQKKAEPPAIEQSAPRTKAQAHPAPAQAVKLPISDTGTVQAVSQPTATPSAAATPLPAHPKPSTAGGAALQISEPRFDTAYLNNPVPVYPALSRRMGEEGKVQLRVFVEASGLPSQVAIKTSSGSSRLDNAAQEAVRRWTFTPAKRGNAAVAAWVIVPIVFNLKN